MSQLCDEPDNVDATRVTCPECGADIGWACGSMHVDGYHSRRIIEAQRLGHKKEEKPK